jgi:hypothetical protein
MFNERKKYVTLKIFFRNETQKIKTSRMQIFPENTNLTG